MSEDLRNALAALQAREKTITAVQDGVIKTLQTINETLAAQTKTANEVNMTFGAVMVQVSTLRILLSAVTSAFVTDDESAAKLATAIRSAMDQNAAWFMGNPSLAGTAVPSEALLLQLLPEPARRHLDSL